MVYPPALNPEVPSNLWGEYLSTIWRERDTAVPCLCFKTPSPFDSVIQMRTLPLGNTQILSFLKVVNHIWFSWNCPLEVQRWFTSRMSIWAQDCLKEGDKAPAPQPCWNQAFCWHQRPWHQGSQSFSDLLGLYFYYLRLVFWVNDSRKVWEHFGFSEPAG